jgi:hypothetical protein
MRAPPSQLIILAMVRPITASKVLLVADRRPPATDRQSTAVRRYRIARLRLDSRPAGDESRFDYLKRAYD